MRALRVDGLQLRRQKRRAVTKEGTGLVDWGEVREPQHTPRDREMPQKKGARDEG